MHALGVISSDMYLASGRKEFYFRPFTLSNGRFSFNNKVKHPCQRQSHYRFEISGKTHLKITKWKDGSNSQDYPSYMTHTMDLAVETFYSVLLLTMSEIRKVRLGWSNNKDKLPCQRQSHYRFEISGKTHLKITKWKDGSNTQDYPSYVTHTMDLAVETLYPVLLSTMSEIRKVRLGQTT